MNESGFERLDTAGLNVVDMSIDFEGTILEADFGSGYKAAAVVGLSLREWTLAADVLPDMDEYLIDAGEHGQQTRAAYLWAFYVRRMEAGGEPFWMRDEWEGRDYLVEFVERRLTYEVFTSVVFAAGLTVRQRRVSGVEGVGGETAEVNPDAF